MHAVLIGEVVRLIREGDGVVLVERRSEIADALEELVGLRDTPTVTDVLPCPFCGSTSGRKLPTRIA